MRAASVAAPAGGGSAAAACVATGQRGSATRLKAGAVLFLTLLPGGFLRVPHSAVPLTLGGRWLT